MKVVLSFFNEPLQRSAAAALQHAGYRITPTSANGRFLLSFDHEGAVSSAPDPDFRAVRVAFVDARGQVRAQIRCHASTTR